MHACGHDVHMTVWLGTARALASQKSKWRGTLVMIAQPAEELGLGALAMLEDGLFTEFPRPDYNLALHVNATLPAGRAAYAPGYVMANVDTVDVVVPGIGGHGAYPHTTKDPVVVAASIVMRLQTLVSRELDPSDAAVVTVGSFQAGAKHNIIPDEARLQLTVRSYSDETRKHLLDGIARIARGEAIAAGMPEDKLPKVTVQDPYTPATYNTPELTEKVAAGLKARFGDRVREVPSVMGGEDFGQFARTQEKIPGVIFWLGAVEPGKFAASQIDVMPLPSLHSPLFAPDYDPAIATGVDAMTSAALELFRD